MKKNIISILCFMLVFLTACQNYAVTENNTTTQNSSAESIETTIETQISPNEETSIASTETQKNILYSTKKTGFSERYDDAPAADTLQFNIKTLKEIKNVATTMSDTAFEAYLVEKRFDFAWLEMVNTVEKFNSLLFDIENIYVAVLNTDACDDVYLTYHVNEKTIFQAVSFSETKRFAFDFYVKTQPIYYFANIEGAEYIKSIEINSVKANVFELENRNGFCADAVLDGQGFNIRASEAQTIEEFESDFARLKFVKIGDLLNETTAEITTTVETIIPEAEAQITE